MIRRYDDWPTRLDAFLESRKLSSFEWGVNDCCIFACDAIQAMTGMDLAAGIRGTYHDIKGALRLLGDGDVGDLASRITLVNGIKEVQPVYAGRGDMVMIDQPELPAMGIVGLSGYDIWAPGEFVLSRMPITYAVRAWRI